MKKKTVLKYSEPNFSPVSFIFVSSLLRYPDYTLIMKGRGPRPAPELLLC